MMRPVRGIEYMIALGGEAGVVVESATGEEIITLPGDEIEFTHILTSSPVPRGAFVKPEGEGCELLTWNTFSRINFADLPRRTRFRFIHLAGRPKWSAIWTEHIHRRPAWFRFEADDFLLLQLDGEEPGLHRKEGRKGPWTYTHISQVPRDDLPWELVSQL